MPEPFDFDDDDAVEQALEEQLRAFRAKFGRDPGPDDPLFFDPDAETYSLHQEYGGLAKTTKPQCRGERAWFTFLARRRGSARVARQLAEASAGSIARALGR